MFHAACFMKPQGDGVYGEIAARQILINCFCVLHLFWPPSICIFVVGTVRGNLDSLELWILALRLDRYSEKLVFIKAFRENLLDFFWFCIGCYVPIFRFSAQQQIAHAPAHHIRIKPSFFELAHNLQNLPWYS